MYGALCEGVSDELSTVFGETGEEFLCEDESRYVSNIYTSFFVIVLLIIFSVDSFDEEDSISLGQAIQDSLAKRKS